MTDDIILLLYVGLLYFVGFMIPVAARTGRSLAIRACWSVALVFLCAALSNSPVILLLVFVLGPLALGAAPGFVIGSALLAFGWGKGSRWRTPAIIVGLAALPIYATAYWAYRDWQSAAMYAALPTADTLPRIPACEPFRSAEPLLSTVIYAEPDQQRRATLPFAEMPVSYPAEYLKYRLPRFPVAGKREEYQIFEMTIADARPTPPEGERDADGNPIPYSMRPPSVLFRFDPRPSVGEFAPRMLRSFGKDISRTDGEGGTRLAASPYGDLQAVVPVTPDPSGKPGEDFVRVRGESIDELVQCGHSGLAGLCKFYFDESGMTIAGEFAKKHMPDWPTVRRNVRSFTKCAVVAGRR